jgi:hypothetical protein
MVRHQILFGIALALAFAANSAAQERLPRWSDYPAKELYKGRAVEPVINTPHARMFRTRLREIAARDGLPNFAGGYLVAIWGCGSACVGGGIVDARTGTVTMLPSVSGWREIHDDFEGIDFRADSRLLVLSGERDEKGDMGRHFYVMEKGRLKLVRSVRNDGDFITPVEK